MNINYTKEIVVHVQLNYDEAAWLRDVTRIYTGPGAEKPEYRSMRETFHSSLDEVLRKGV